MNAHTQTMMSSGTYTSQQGCYTYQNGVYQHTTIGTVLELTPEEYRVALTPSMVKEFVLNGHTVYVQTGAGLKSGFQDEHYQQAGATMLTSAEEVYQKSSIMMKVMQPLPMEYNYIQPQQVIFTFLSYNTVSQAEFFTAMMQRQAIIVSYQHIMMNNTFPVFNAWSELTGYVGVQQLMKFMETQMGGYGKIMGSVAGVRGCNVLILGAGNCGVRAALFAAGTGANVTIMDMCSETLRKVQGVVPSNVTTLQYSNETLERFLPTVDVLIGTVMPTSFQAPVLVTDEQMKLMRPGTIAMDLAIEMGGNFQMSTPQTLQAPTFTWNGITMYCNTQITNFVPRTFSYTIGNAALPWVLQVANKGFRRAVIECAGLQQGVCIFENYMTSQWWIATPTSGFTYTPVEQVLEKEITELTTTQQQTGTTSNLVQLKQQLTTLRSQQGTQLTGFFTIEA